MIVRRPSRQLIKVGNEYKLNTGGTAVVLELTGGDDCIVLMKGGVKEYKTELNRNNLKNGNAKNCFFRSVHGVGYLGKGIKELTKDQPFDKAYLVIYRKWLSMIRRVYGNREEYKKNYSDVTVHEHFHNFSNFQDHVYELVKRYGLTSLKGYHLDKDLRAIGKREYSPDTVCLLTHKLNVILALGENEIGIPYISADTRYKSIQLELSFVGEARTRLHVNLSKPAGPENAYKAYMGTIMACRSDYLNKCLKEIENDNLRDDLTKWLKEYEKNFLKLHGIETKQRFIDKLNAFKDSITG